MPAALFKALAERPFTVGLLIAVVVQILFMVNLGRPITPYFDEMHYVPAAKTLMEMNIPRNVEHPLLGKQLIALGIWLFGDNALGWRIIATLAGTASVVAGYAFILLLLGAMRPAVVAAILLMLNQVLFIQARIAMLDVFLGAFLLWALVLMLWSAKAPDWRAAWLRWIAGSVLLGMAVGVKWAAIPYVALAGLAFLVLRLRDAMKARKPLLSAVGGKGQVHWTGIATVPGLLVLGVVSVLVYFATFWPAFFYEVEPMTFARLIPFQREMYELQTQILPPHTYQSQWWSWPLMLRPIWYFYEFSDGAQRGVLLVGNPIIMWGGLVAVPACLWSWFRTRRMAPLAVALLWIASLAIYIVIPKSLGFYYYYHLSAMFICLALAVAFHSFDFARRRGLEEWFAAASLVMFLYFYPIISGAALSEGSAFHRWMWFKSWM
ncbi:dolichyl-phosphate-mannose--protein mannosyltransferase [Nostoc sp. 3335mG]|nr:dolichyl-phosphate-mannose--protein mannosyltransferase [Nostoc sp. 3335mG]